MIQVIGAFALDENRGEALLIELGNESLEITAAMATALPRPLRVAALAFLLGWLGVPFCRGRLASDFTSMENVTQGASNAQNSDQSIYESKREHYFPGIPIILDTLHSKSIRHGSPEASDPHHELLFPVDERPL